MAAAVAAAANTNRNEQALTSTTESPTAPRPELPRGERRPRPEARAAGLAPAPPPPHPSPQRGSRHRANARTTPPRTASSRPIIERQARAGATTLAAVKRRPALIPLSHDHHHALAAARRLRLAADGGDASAEAAAFERFFAEESVRHFRDEEERLFPLVAHAEEAEPLVVRALLEHQQLHALARRLRTGQTAPIRELAELLEAHVR